MNNHLHPYISDSVDRMIDNELSRGYEVKCIRCGKPLKTWFKCSVCYRIYFCDCYQLPICSCVDIRTSLLNVIEDMEQLLGG